MKSDAVNWKQVRTMLLRVPNCFPKYAKAIELAELNATPASGLESTLMSPSLHPHIYTIFVLSVDDASEDSGFKYYTFRISPLILGTDSFDSSRAGLFKYLSALSLELFELK